MTRPRVAEIVMTCSHGSGGFPRKRREALEVGRRRSKRRSGHGQRHAAVLGLVNDRAVVGRPLAAPRRDEEHPLLASAS
jgi:hypothetical protein